MSDLPKVKIPRTRAEYREQWERWRDLDTQAREDEARTMQAFYAEWERSGRSEATEAAKRAWHDACFRKGLISTIWTSVSYMHPPRRWWRW